MKKNEFKCPQCSLSTATTNIRRYANGMCLRRKLCKNCNIMYVVIYKDDKEHVINTYKPKKLVRIEDLLEV